jgi:hypothetical protein
MAYDMSIKGYARHRRVTPAAVRKAIKSGRITTVKGKIDAGLADAQWRANTDETKPRNSVSGNPGGFSRPPVIPPTPTFATAGQALPRTGGYAAARAVRETYDARLRELDYKVRTGELVSVPEVRVVAFNTARRSRDLLLAIPDRVSAVLAGLTDASEVHRILAEELRRVCQELSESPTFTRGDHADLH